ncbi:hypothetical protein BASA83_006247 [Batrachochytrium salamandrivorans]|nr:hypothetical protein BASA83_006247 [Batrachochytrium salamandrivorans]
MGVNSAPSIQGQMQTHVHGQPQFSSAMNTTVMPQMNMGHIMGAMMNPQFVQQFQQQLQSMQAVAQMMNMYQSGLESITHIDVPARDSASFSVKAEIPASVSLLSSSIEAGALPVSSHLSRSDQMQTDDDSLPAEMCPPAATSSDIPSNGISASDKVSSLQDETVSAALAASSSRSSYSPKRDAAAPNPTGEQRGSLVVVRPAQPILRLVLQLQQRVRHAGNSHLQSIRNGQSYSRSDSPSNTRSKSPSRSRPQRGRSRSRSPIRGRSRSRSTSPRRSSRYSLRDRSRSRSRSRSPRYGTRSVRSPEPSSSRSRAYSPRRRARSPSDHVRHSSPIKVAPSQPLEVDSRLSSDRNRASTNKRRRSISAEANGRRISRDISTDNAAIPIVSNSSTPLITDDANGIAHIQKIPSKLIPRSLTGAPIVAPKSVSLHTSDSTLHHNRPQPLSTSPETMLSHDSNDVDASAVAVSGHIPASTLVYVENIPNNVTHTGLRQYLSVYGTIVNISPLEKQSNGRCSTIVSFKLSSQAELCANSPNFVNGSRIFCLLKPSQSLYTESDSHAAAAEGNTSLERGSPITLRITGLRIPANIKHIREKVGAIAKMARVSLIKDRPTEAIVEIDDLNEAIYMMETLDPSSIGPEVQLDIDITPKSADLIVPEISLAIPASHTVLESATPAKRQMAVTPSKSNRRPHIPPKAHPVRPTAPETTHRRVETPPSAPMTHAIVIRNFELVHSVKYIQNQIISAIAVFYSKSLEIAMIQLTSSQIFSVYVTVYPTIGPIAPLLLQFDGFPADAIMSEIMTVLWFDDESNIALFLSCNMLVPYLHDSGGHLPSSFSEDAHVPTSISAASSALPVLVPVERDATPSAVLGLSTPVASAAPPTTPSSATSRPSLYHSNSDAYSALLLLDTLPASSAVATGSGATSSNNNLLLDGTDASRLPSGVSHPRYGRISVKSFASNSQTDILRTNVVPDKDMAAMFAPEDLRFSQRFLISESAISALQHRIEQASEWVVATVRVAPNGNATDFQNIVEYFEGRILTQ